MRYDLKNMITTGVMAKELGIDPKTLKKWAKNGRVPYYRNPINKYWYFHKKDVLEALGIDRTIESLIIDMLNGLE